MIYDRLALSTYTLIQWTLLDIPAYDMDRPPINHVLVDLHQLTGTVLGGDRLTQFESPGHDICLIELFSWAEDISQRII